MSSTRTWFITGTSRGIGLGLVKHLLTNPANVVIGSCRNPASATHLNALAASSSGRLHVITLDVSDDASIAASAELPIVKKTLANGLDFLVNNAGVGQNDEVFTLSSEALIETYRANVVGPALISQAFLPYLEKVKRGVIVHISSTLGSIEVGTAFGPKNPSYSISKTALNKLAAVQSAAKPNLTIFSICPGWVKTDMGGEEAQLEVEVSVTGLINVISNAPPEHSGKFLRYNGEFIVW
ncbi:NAD-P-binding protein [Amylostereum chailletii]|nr:NAD-P-binding protein [Amylostereum chailletii]